MPYSSESDVPSYVPKSKRAQWMAIWNKTYADISGDHKTKETAAFRAAGVVFKGVSITMLKALEEHMQKIGEGWEGFDLDGCLANDEDIPADGEVGSPISEMINFLRSRMNLGIPCRIVTARVAPSLPDDVVAYQQYVISQWLQMNVGFYLPIQSHKDPGMIRLYDDRARQVLRNKGKLAPDINPV